MNKKSKKYAQQLVEFALILPVLMIVLIVIVEIGLALNIRLSLTEAVKISVAQVKISFNQNGDTLQDKLNAAKIPVLTAIKSYFTNHNLPYADTLAVDIAPLDGNQMALVMVSYNYKPVFILPNIFGGTIIPTQYTFISTQIINAALLDVNSELFNYNSTSDSYKSYILSSFDKTSSSFDARTGVLKSQDIDSMDVRYQLAFLVGFNTNDYKYARLFNWWGEDLLPQNLALAMDTGNLAVKSPYYSALWVDTDIPYTWVLSSLGFSQAVYARMDTNPTFKTNKLDLAKSGTIYNAGIPWFNQSGCSTCGSGDSDPFKGDMTSNNIDNLIKRGMGFLFASSGDASGSYDTLLATESGSYPIKNYTFAKSLGGYSNLLKLFIPANAAKPADLSDGFNYSFYIDSSGKRAGAGAQVGIVDCYLDNDGDGIPNAWDGLPGSTTNTQDANYFDANGNGIIDGLENSVTRNTTPADIINIISGTFLRTEYISMPMKVDGTLNPASFTYTPIPVPSTATYSVDIYKITSGTALYYKNTTANNLTRKVTGWDYSPSEDIAKKVNFIFGTDGDTTINLKKSNETNILGTGPFSATNKVLYE